MRPSGVARLVRLCTVLLTIVTCGTWQTDRSIPPAIPRMIGLVRIPFTVSFARFPAAFFSPFLFHKKQNDHSQNIIKRDISNQHQRSHIGFSVNITDKCDSQQCRITSKRRLSKLSTDILILHQSGTQDTDQSAANRDSRTEADKFSVPQCLKVCTPEIFQQQQRQRRPEDKSVDFLYKTFTSSPILRNPYPRSIVKKIGSVAFKQKNRFSISM